MLSRPSGNVSIESGSHSRFGFPLPVALGHSPVTALFPVDLVGWGRGTAVEFRPGGLTALSGYRPESDRVERLGG